MRLGQAGPFIIAAVVVVVCLAVYTFGWSLVPVAIGIVLGVLLAAGVYLLVLRPKNKRGKAAEQAASTPVETAPTASAPAKTVPAASAPVEAATAAIPAPAPIPAASAPVEAATAAIPAPAPIPVASAPVEAVPTADTPAKAAPAAGSGKSEAGAWEGSFGPLWWSFEDGLLRIGGQGDMPNDCDFPWGFIPERKSLKRPAIDLREITAVVIEEGVLSIAKKAFSYCRNLSHVTLPNSLKTIGASAFEESGLEEIILPAGMTRVAPELFTGCSELRKVVIPESVEEIGWRAFQSCTSLSRITLPKGLKTIGGRAFSHTGIRELELPEGLVSIGSWAFYEMPLTELTIPDSVTNVENPLFPKRPSFPVRLPKGKEDTPISPAQTAEEHLHNLAYSFFGDRGDVLLEPTGNPVDDRYSAMERLWHFVERYLHTTKSFNGSHAGFCTERGKVFFCSDYEVRSLDTDLGYDGGSGHSWDVEEYGATITILEKTRVRQATAGLQLVQEKPFPIWWEGRRGLLEQPFGLSDYFEIESDYPIHLPATTNEEDAIE